MPDNWMMTRSGLLLDLGEPKAASIHPEDIAVALSRVPRWCGHTTETYSVAQHSVLVAVFSPRDVRLSALLHDATEAYLCDLPRPVKQMCPGYREVEARLHAAICERFGIPSEIPLPVKLADDQVLATENRDLMPRGLWKSPVPPLQTLMIEPWSEAEAAARWLEMFHRYQSQGAGL